MRACCFIIVRWVWKRLKTTHQHKNVTRDHITRGRVPHSVYPEVVRVKSAKRLSRWLWDVRKNSAFFNFPSSTIRQHWKVLFGGFSSPVNPPLCSGKFNRKTHELCAEWKGTVTFKWSRNGGSQSEIWFRDCLLSVKSCFGQNLIVSDVTQCPWWLFQRKLSSIICFGLWRSSLAPKNPIPKSWELEKGFSSVPLPPACYHSLYHSELACLHRLNKNISRSAVHTQKSSKTPNEIAGF